MSAENPPRRRPPARVAFALLAIAFFATPVSLRAVGVTADAFENRPLAGPPRLSQGWDVFDQATRFLSDRMPLREEAVRANTRLSQEIFGTTPRYGAREGTVAGGGALPFAGAGGEGRAAPRAPERNARVVEGREGWLFLGDELEAACRPAVAETTAAARWRELVSLARARGKRAVLVVPPDKATVYPEKLPARLPRRRCASRGKAALWRAVERLPRGSGVIPLRRRLLARKASGGDRLYTVKDSHWTTVGSIEMTRAALEVVGRGVRVRPTEVRDGGDVRILGDLTTLLGAPQRTAEPTRRVVRSPGAPRVPGRTLFIRDSYGDIGVGQLLPYFASVRRIYWFNSSPRTLAREIAAADTIVMENVERELLERAGPRGPVTGLLAELRRRAR